MSYLTYFLLLFFVSFFCCTLFTALLIPRLRAMRMGQKILDIGPAWHAPKEGTPTMGGLAFLLASIISGLLFLTLAVREQPFRDVYPFLVTLLYCVANGAVGIVDDLTKLRHRRNDGLTPAQKLILQTTLAAAYLAILRLLGVLPDRWPLPFGLTLSLEIPGYFLLLLLLIGMTNCANLTDGVDGLASAVGAVIFAAYGFFSIRAGLVPPAVLSALFLGCALAFLLFNRHPARIFMGDTGSLLLGAAAVSLPILLGMPLLSLVTGVVYVVEGASVILQVLYYKATRKRLFLMAPIHHHFEKCGWSENKIVAVFSALTLLFCVLAGLLL